MLPSGRELLARGATVPRVIACCRFVAVDRARRHHALDRTSNQAAGSAAAGLDAMHQRVDDLSLDTGFTIEELQARAERIAPAEQGSGAGAAIGASVTVVAIRIDV